MADHIWFGSTDNWTTAGNWPTGGVPVDAGDIRLMTGNQSVLTNIDQRSVADIDPLSLVIGGSYTGSVGNATTALKFDDFDATNGYIEIDVSGNPDQQINIDTDSCPLVIVHNTGSNEFACFFSASAVGITTMYVSGGRVRIGASMIIGTLVVLSEQGRHPTIHIEAGAAITAIEADAGVIRSLAALGTVKLAGTAKLFQLGEAAGNITSLEVSDNAVAWLGGAGFTVTTAVTRNTGVIDSSQPHISSKKWTFTNARAVGGVIRTKRIDVFTNTPVEAGGSIPNAQTKRVLVAGASGGIGASGLFGGG